MATYTIPYSFATQPNKACAILKAFALHRAEWGKTISAIALTGGQLTVTLTPNLTQAQIDHLMDAANGEQ